MTPGERAKAVCDAFTGVPKDFGITPITNAIRQAVAEARAEALKEAIPEIRGAVENYCSHPLEDDEDPETATCDCDRIMAEVEDALRALSVAPAQEER